MQRQFLRLGALVFLIALAINCVQATQISVYPVLSPFTALNSDSAKTTGSESPVLEDESDRYLVSSQLRSVSRPGYNPEPVFARSGSQTPFSFTSHTVLKL